MTDDVRFVPVTVSKVATPGMTWEGETDDSVGGVTTNRSDRFIP